MHHFVCLWTNSIAKINMLSLSKQTSFDHYLNSGNIRLAGYLLNHLGHDNPLTANASKATLLCTRSNKCSKFDYNADVLFLCRESISHHSVILAILSV